MPLPRALKFLWLRIEGMRVREIVRKVSDKVGREVFGRVMAVQRRSNLITVVWEDGKISDHNRDELLLVDSMYRKVDSSDQED